MITPEALNKQLILCTKRVIRKYAKKWTENIKLEYSRVNVHGDAKVWSKLEDDVNDLLVLSIFGKGQKVFIGEFGKGSLMDRHNPNLDFYIHSDLFNQERIRNNLAVMTRPKKNPKSKRKEYYYDLDGNKYEKKAIVSKNLEDNNSPRYKPIPPAHIMYKEVIEIGLQNLIDDILDAIVVEVAYYKLIDGLKINIKI